MPRRLLWRDVAVASSFWDASLPTIRIAVLSDLHIGSPGMSLSRLDAIVNAVNDKAADIIVLLGDYLVDKVLGGRFVHPADIVKILGRLKARHGVFAIMGNHEYIAIPSTRLAFERNGIPLLENKAISLQMDGKMIFIGGLGDRSIVEPNAAPIVAASEGFPLILLGHDPATVRASGVKAALRLAGHLHAGQVKLPHRRPIWVPGPTPRHLAYGLFDEPDGPIYISSGLGCSILPFRIGAPAEIAMVTLRTGQGIHPAGIKVN